MQFKDPKLIYFSEFDCFYSEFLPVTQYGKAAKADRLFYTDAEKLEEQFDLTGIIMPAVKDRPRNDKIRFHLRAIPKIDLSPDSLRTLPGLFLIKEFLENLYALSGLLTKQQSEAFGLAWRSEELLSMLKKGQTFGGGFSVSSVYDENLALIREKLRLSVENIKSIKKEKLSLILRKYGLDFKNRDFLIIPCDGRGGPELFTEPFDRGRIMIRPVFGDLYIQASEEHEKLREEERKAEKAVARKLAERTAAEAETLRGYEKAVRQLDLSLERARLALKYDMRRPAVDLPEGLLLKNGRFLPLQERINKAGWKYTALDADFRGKTNIISGSNMGGKTVVLKTVAFMQLAAQSAFFVPAETFRTRLYDSLSFIGGISSDKAKGLSSFGLEIREFADNYERLDTQSAMLLIDEFARTTNIDEGFALFKAAVEELGNKDAFTLAATHFSGMSVGKSSNFIMRGFDSEAFSDYFRANKNLPVSDRLTLINNFMRYELIPASSTALTGDALKIAGILGIEEKIIRRAEKIMEEQRCSKVN